jgi:hypothetical protein
MTPKAVLKNAGRNPIEPRSSQGIAVPEFITFAVLTAGLGSWDAIRKSCGDVDFAKAASWHA